VLTAVGALGAIIRPPAVHDCVASSLRSAMASYQIESMGYVNKTLKIVSASPS
jgi:hypothetical protein